MTAEIEDLTSVKGLKVVTVNARSIMKKFHNFEPLIRAADICCFTESWLSDAILDSQIQIDGYACIRQDRSPHIKKRGGGIAVFIQDNWQYDLLPDKSWVNRNHEILSLLIYPAKA